MVKVHILGATTLIGEYFKDTNKDYEFICYSRKNKSYRFLDINNTEAPTNYSFNNSYLISFASVWLTEKFLKIYSNDNNNDFKSIKGLILFSSTSAVTKRFASNNFDKNLSKKIINSENEIISLCKRNNINCFIIRPTIIYGNYKNISDKNLTIVLGFLKKLPICFIPSSTGLRQPIHFSQLSKLTYFLLDKLILMKNGHKRNIQIIEVGGDEELNYSDMLERLINSKLNKSNIKCKLIKIPNLLFYLIIFPTLIFKTKIFEALLRIKSDLSGFPKCSSYMDDNLIKFPFEEIT